MAAAADTFVIVKTVVLVKVGHGAGDGSVAVAMAAFGAGSMATALTLPGLLERRPDRTVMLGAAAGLAATTLAAGMRLTAGLPGWGPLLALWATLGALYAAVLTPSGRLLRRSLHAGERGAVFAALFAPSHACWSMTYPLAGALGAAGGLGPTLALMGLLATASVAAALRLWPAATEAPLAHSYPHAGTVHAHPVVIDDDHRIWPTQG